MNFFRYLLPIAIAACGLTTSSAFAECAGSHEIIHDPNFERDFEAVQDYVTSKRTIPLAEKACNLSIAGDIRFEWSHMVEKQNCNKLRGKNGSVEDINSVPTFIADGDPRVGVPYSTNAFDVEFNLYFDYVCDRAWGVAWLEFDNIAGTEQSFRGCADDPAGCHGSGCCDSLCLKKAYFGYNICADGDSRFDVEIGRRPLYTVFDSRIEFQSRFDGILLKYARGFECLFDFYWNVGGFVVDERVNHFAWITEAGFLNIMDYGIDFKYSFVDWAKRGTNRCHVRNPRGWEYRISQWSFAYNFNPEILCTSAKLYGAVLYNHDAHRRNETTNKKRGLGWYAGFIIGQVCHEGDWAFDVNYQYVQPQSIPDCDISGIDRGNVLLDTFTMGTTPGNSSGGRGNYKGWRFEGLYALTDNLAIDASLEFSQQATRTVGGKHSFSQFQIEAIYAF